MLSLEAVLLTQLKIKDITNGPSDTENAGFSFLSSSFEWLKITILQFCSTSASRVQQCLPKVQVSVPIKQKAELKELDRLSLLTIYRRSIETKHHSVLGLAFTDAERPSDSAQLSAIECPLVESLK